MRLRWFLTLTVILLPIASANGHAPGAMVEQVVPITPIGEFNLLIARSLMRLQIYDKLHKPVTLFPAENIGQLPKEFRQAGTLPVKDVLEYFSDASNLPEVIDDSLFQKAGIEDVEESKVVIGRNYARCADCLTEVVNQIGAEYHIESNFIVIVPRCKSSVWRLFGIEPKSEK